MSKRTKYAGILICIVIVVAVMGGVWAYYSGFDVEEPSYIYIDRDDGVDSIGKKIEETGKPQSMITFHLYAQLLNLKECLHTGKYEIAPDMTMLQLVHHIRNHSQQPVSLVVPSVRLIDNMAKNLGNQLMVDSAEIAQYMLEGEQLEAWGYTPPTLPAFFIPNTYEVYWDISVDALFHRLKKENDIFWEGRMAKLKEVSEYAGEEMTKEKIITLASIIDSETANNEEKPTIAALYMNRMRAGMPLQSDPTVIFALQDFTIRRVLHEHLKVDSPYNTYKYAGLPLGPIRVPSIAGIDAVLNHTKNNYIYMCAKEDFSGTHNFAVTYAEHQKNAARYVKALNQRGIH